MLVAAGGFILIWDGVLRLNDPYVDFEPSPRAYRGEGIMGLYLHGSEVGLITLIAFSPS
jgi:hypothetical protein